MSGRLYHPVFGGIKSPDQYGADPTGINDASLDFIRAWANMNQNHHIIKGIPGSIFRIASDTLLVNNNSGETIYDFQGCIINLEAKITFRGPSGQVHLIGGSWITHVSMAGLTVIEIDECVDFHIDAARIVGDSGTNSKIVMTTVSTNRLYLTNSRLSWTTIDHATNEFLYSGNKITSDNTITGAGTRHIGPNVT